MGRLKVTVGEFVIELEGRERDLLSRLESTIEKLSSTGFEKALYVVGEKQPKIEELEILIPKAVTKKTRKRRKTLAEKPQKKLEPKKVEAPAKAAKPKKVEAPKKEPKQYRDFNPENKLAQFDENGNEICQICGKVMNRGSQGMSLHMKAHPISYKEYREKYPIPPKNE
ncbi:hypothetical protein J7L01_01470 [bacterium]|nr:hypothetical protein [bacterium]